MSSVTSSCTLFAGKSFAATITISIAISLWSTRRTATDDDHLRVERRDEPGDADEIAPSYVFFASGTMSSYYSGEVLAPIGGETLPG